MTNSLLKEQKKHLMDEVYAVLKKEGFSQKKMTSAWRRSDTKIDIMRLEFYSASICDKWRVPIGSFSIKPSCYFSFMPSLQAGKLWPDALEMDTLSDFYSQMRLKVFKGIKQIKQTENQSFLQAVLNKVSGHKIEPEPLNIWWIGIDEEAFIQVTEDVIRQIQNKALIFYKRLESKNELIRTLMEDKDVWGRDTEDGIYDFGGDNSIKGLCYTGFTAMHIERFDIARDSLERCLDKLVDKYEKFQKNTMYEGKDGVERKVFDENLIACIENKLSEIKLLNSG